MDSQVLNSYDRFAGWYQDLQEVYYRSDTAEKLARFLVTSNPDVHSILDCACGVGALAVDLAELGFQVTCSDGSGEMLKYARQNVSLRGQNGKEKGKGIDFQQCDWRHLGERVGRRYDCVLNIGINLYHLPKEEIGAAIRSMKDRLNPGGILIVDNKRWQEVLIRDADRSLKACLVERRPIIRLFSGTPVKGFYYLDIATAEGQMWVLSVFRLLADHVHTQIGTTGTITTFLGDIPVRFWTNDGLLNAEYLHAMPNTVQSITSECVVIRGYPILSREIADLMSEAGLDGVKILDKYEALDPAAARSQRSGLYDLIVGFNTGYS